MVIFIVVDMKGFEPLPPCESCRYSGQTELHVQKCCQYIIILCRSQRKEPLPRKLIMVQSMLNVLAGLSVGLVGMLAAFFDSIQATEIILGLVAAISAVIAAYVNNRSSRTQAKTTELGMNVEANNKLIDQLQETIAAQQKENDRLRQRLADSDKRYAELELRLREVQQEAADLRKQVGA